MRKPKAADADAIFARLVARNEQLDRQFAVFCEQRGLTAGALELAAARGRACGATLDAARQQLAEQLAQREEADARASWEAVCRPSVDALSAACRGRLLRA